MKINSLISHALLAAILGYCGTASAQFNFGSPFDWFDDDDYRDSGRYDRGYGRDRGRDQGRRNDEWEPDYWRERYFDDFDGGDFFGDGFGRGRFGFDMDAEFDSDFDGRYDGDYDQRYRGRDGYRNQDQPYARDTRRRGRNLNNDGYQDDYWRNYANDFDRRDRPMSRTPQGQQRNGQRRDNGPIECR